MDLAVLVGMYCQNAMKSTVFSPIIKRVDSLNEEESY